MDKQPSDPIIVWEYHSAPKELQISQNGGDEDWLAEVPPHLADTWIPWMREGGGFGCCGVEEHDHPTKPGWKIRIGCHA